MSLPQRVKEAAAAADEQIKAMAQQQLPLEPADDETEVEAGAVQPTDVVSFEQQELPLEQQNPDLAQVKADAEKWEQRYRSLDGMIKARDRQIDQLHDLIANMQQAKPAEPTKDDTPSSLVSDKDIDAFGADYIDLARRVAREENQAYIKQLEGQLNELKGQLGSVSKTAALSAQDRFENSLTGRVANWRSTDTNPKFIEWLQASPVRQRMFAEAAQSHDVEGLAYFYETFAPAAPVAQETAKPTAKQKLERQIAPTKQQSVQAPAATDAQGKVWTRSEISDVYGNKKRYAADEFSKIEREIAAAQREGRVDYNR